MIHGIINVYKEKGFTSHDVVAKLRGILKQKKIGHTGTLDPDAQGVLPVCLGKGTKVCELLADKDKTYRAKLRLGVTTDTQDMTGTVLSKKAVTASEEEVRRVIESFVGAYDQIPPMYSALKVNGKKLYELARAGVEVERKARRVYLHEIRIIEVSLPFVTMEVTCSKGTYIRTLCHDIGERLGCGGCMEELLRTRVGIFAIEDSLRLEQIQKLVDEKNAESVVRTVDSLFLQLPALHTYEKYDRLVHNGNQVQHQQYQEEATESDQVRMYDSSNRFIGVYQWEFGRKAYVPVKIFWENEQ